MFDSTPKAAVAERPTTGARSPQRILMVAPQPFFRPRGTPFSVLHRIRALTEMGHQIDLVTYPFGEDVEIPGLRIYRTSRPWGVRDVRIGPSLAKIPLDWKIYRLTARLLKENQYDILHTHEEAAFFGVGLARRHRLRHVYDMHSSLPQQLSNFRKFNLGPFIWLFSWFERRTIRSADGVITICPDLADRVREEGIDSPHSMIENFGDDTRIFPATPRDVRGDLGLEDRTILLYAGTFEAYQGIDLLLRSYAAVASEFPLSHLLLVGGRPEQVKHYEAAAAELGLKSRTTFTGQVPPTEIPSFVGACDVLVSPRSSGTNTPLKIYSYLRSGKPLLATDLPTHRQVLDDTISILAPPTVEGFGAGLRETLRDESRRRTVVDAALAVANERFSDAAYVERVGAFYDEVLTPNGR